jgi:hypothetical protein
MITEDKDTRVDILLEQLRAATRGITRTMATESPQTLTDYLDLIDDTAAKLKSLVLDGKENDSYKL